MKFGIDVDGVLARFNEAFAERLVHHTGTRHVPGKVISTDAFPQWHWPQYYGYTTTDIDATWERVKADISFWVNLQPYPNAVDELALLRSLRMSGHDIYFITARPGDRAKLQTERWLQDYGMLCPTVLIAYDKGACARALPPDFYIDDRPENTEATPYTCGTFLVDRAWNRSWDSQRVGVLRVSGIAEAVERFLSGARNA